MIVMELRDCDTLFPTWHEYKNERNFLASEAVQASGKKCGVVRVRSPPEFQPSILNVVSEPDPITWMSEVSVLEQGFGRLDMARGGDHLSDVFLVKRLLPGQYPLDMQEFLKRSEKSRRGAIVRLIKTNINNPIYEVPVLPRDLYWETRPFHERVYYGADIPGTKMRPDQMEWNFNSPTFPCLTNEIAKEDKTPGVDTPFLFVG